MHAEVDGERLSAQQFANFFNLLVTAGTETTRNARLARPASTSTVTTTRTTTDRVHSPPTSVAENGRVHPTHRRLGGLVSFVETVVKHHRSRTHGTVDTALYILAMYKNLSMTALGHSVPFEQTCSLARKHDFDGVELDLLFLRSLGQPHHAVDWFSATGLKPGGYSLRAAWRESDSDETFEKSLETVVADSELVAQLDCRRCFTSVMPRSEKLDFYQHFDLVVPRLTRVAEILAKHHITLGFEFLGPPTLRTNRHKDFVHTLDGARTFAAAIGMHSLNTGVLLDTFHWYTSGGSIQEIEHLDHNEVVNVCLSDGFAGRSADEQLDHEREMPGSTGIVDIPGLVGALHRIAYVGPLTVQPFCAAIKAMSPDDAAAAANAALDRILAG